MKNVKKYTAEAIMDNFLWKPILYQSILWPYFALWRSHGPKNERDEEQKRKKKTNNSARFHFFSSLLFGVH